MGGPSSVCDIPDCVNSCHLSCVARLSLHLTFWPTSLRQDAGRDWISEADLLFNVSSPGAPKARFLCRTSLRNAFGRSFFLKHRHRAKILEEVKLSCCY